MVKRMVLALVLVLGLGVSGDALAADHGSPAGEGVEAGGPRKHVLLEFDAATAAWVLVIFIVLLAVLYPTAWKQVLEGLKKREEHIRKEIGDAEEARAKAEGTLKEYQSQLSAAEEKVREMIGVATAQGEKIAAEIRGKGQQEAEEAKRRAMRDIEEAGKQAVREIYAKAAELSTSIAGKILRRNLNAEDQQDLVRRSLEEMRSVGRDS